MHIVVHPGGTLRCLYSEALDLRRLGWVTIRRVSHVEPDEQGRWWADLAPVDGPLLGPFPHRSEALAAEASWLEANRLAEPETDSSYPEEIADVRP